MPGQREVREEVNLTHFGENRAINDRIDFERDLWAGQTIAHLVYPISVVPRPRSG